MQMTYTPQEMQVLGDFSPGETVLLDSTYYADILGVNVDLGTIRIRIKNGQEMEIDQFRLSKAPEVTR